MAKETGMARETGMEKNSERIVFLPVMDDGDVSLEVGINGVMYLLRRGETINVTPEIYEVLKNAGLIAERGDNT